MAMKTLTGIRPSLWARTDCTRAAAYQGLGYEPAPHPPEAEEWFFRGNVFEEIVVRQVIAKNGADNVERQVEIPIEGIGTGHADFYLPQEKTLGEVKSTTAPYPESETFSSGVRQLRIYGVHHPEAEQGALMMIDPNRMKPADVYTVRWDDNDRAQIEAQRLEIVEAVEGGAMPGRVCRKPGDARGRMCPFAVPCFQDWTPPEVPEVPDPKAVDAASRLAAIVAQEKPHKEALKALDEGKKAAHADLAVLVPEGDSTVGPFSVRRTHVVRHPSFSVKAFEAAGLDIEPLAEFFRGGSEHDRFTVTKAEEWGEVEYGPAPF